MAIGNYTKMQLVDAARRAGVVVGDYARMSKADVASLLVGEAGSEEAAERLLAPSALISGVFQPAPQPAPTFAAPVYPDIRVVAKVKAAKLFGVRSLGDLEVEVWNDPAAPAVMEGFVWNAAHLRYALCALNRQRPIWLGGPPGTGKTEFVRQLCARLGRALIRVQFDASLESYHIIGGERVKAASTVWQDGLVLQGYRRPGAVILLDEVSFARSEYTSSLHAALEPAGVITVPETGEVVHRAPGVWFVAADNSNGRGDADGTNVGLREQSNAFINRFAGTLVFRYLDAEDEAKVVAQQSGCNAATAALIVAFIGVCRAKAETGALETPPTMREAIYLAEALVDGIAPRAAFEVVIVNRAPVDCQEILQQLWVANVSPETLSAAVRGDNATKESE